MKNILICLLFLNYSLNQQEIQIINSKNNNNYDMVNKSSSFEFNKNNKNKKNLILGIIHNYSLRRILPFFKSLIHTTVKTIIIDVNLFRNKIFLIDFIIILLLPT